MLFYVLMGTFLIIALLFLLNYVWKKRHIWYCAWKLPGPFTLPFIGSVFEIVTVQVHKDLYSAVMELCRRYKSIFKVGILNDLYVVNSEPEDVEILLKTCLGKPPFYTTWDELINNKCNIVTAPVDIWRERRKEFNRSFNLQILDSYHEIFFKYAKEAVKVLKHKCGRVNKDFFFDIWRCDVDIFFESLADIDPHLFNEPYEFLNLIVRAEEIIMERFRNVTLMLNPLYRLSRLHKEAKAIAVETLRIVGKIITLKKIQVFDKDFTQDELRMKRLFNQLCTTLNRKSITEEDIQAEVAAMIVAGSETTAIAKTSIILTLGILPDIQEKVYQEICAVAPEADDFSPEDINKMEYLERVIKETLRFFPVIPFIMRSVDVDTKLKSYVQPAGTHVIIPIVQIHRDPSELWADPLKFDPDRFLPEEVEKRHRCSYIPFSFGSRNCIGYDCPNSATVCYQNIGLEVAAMVVAASETTAIAKTSIILTLGILPDIQEKVYQEICSVAPGVDDFSPENINKMEYLERVIKETLRLFPVIPLIMRSVYEDTKLKSYVQPAGTHVIIPIVQIHRSPELWPNPLKFDPDRFLPEEVEKRHRCAYIPFSFGSRNCIGLKYAMISMKVIIAQIVRQFVIKTLDCNSLEDVEIEFKMMNHPKNYRIVLEERFKEI